MISRVQIGLGAIALATLSATLAGAMPPPQPPRLPDRNVSEQPIEAPSFVYPPQLRAQHKTGVALVECIVATDGGTRDCRIIGNAEGGAAFAAAVLDYVSHARYLPAIVGGRTVEVSHQWIFPPGYTSLPLYLRAQPDGPVSEQPIAGPALVYPPRLQQIGRQGVSTVDCDVTEDGLTKDCKIICTTGSSSFADSALDFVSHSRYSPAVKEGVRYETRRQWTIPFGLPSPAPAPLCGP